MLLSIARRHQLRMGADYLLFWRVLNALDSTVLRLSEEFDIIAEMRDYFERALTAVTRSPLEDPVNVEQMATVADLGRSVPDHALGILHSLRSGPGEWRVIAEESAVQRRDRDRQATWLALGLLTVALCGLAASAPVSETIRHVLLAMAVVLIGTLVWLTSASA
jgi:hypothetical protein